MKHALATKKFFQTFVTLWETNSSEDIARKLDIDQKRVTQIASRIRKAGYDLPYKRQNNTWHLLLDEALAEINFPKKEHTVVKRGAYKKGTK